MRQTEAGIEYHFGAARNPSFAIGLTAFVLIWTCTLWLQIALDAPFIFPLLTGLFELLRLAIVADLWPERRRSRLDRVRFDAGKPSPARTTRVFTSSDIVKIDLHISMQTNGRSGTPITRSEQRQGPRATTVARQRHPEQSTGRVLSHEMRTAIGLQS